MIRNFLFILSLALSFMSAYGDSNTDYIKAHAVRVDNPYLLSDSVYSVLSPFQILMMGEMHGTNEPAQFVIGLSNLLTNKGDSVSVGLEIPDGWMTNFISSHTDSSIYQSYFFSTLAVLDGRESFAWASVISHLKNNPRVQLFFFDRNEDEGKLDDRDSTMFLKIKKQILLHPNWKMVTLSGNAHTMIKSNEKRMAMYLREDKELNIATKVCTFTNYYMQGSCRANFKHGLEERTFSRPPNHFDTTFSFDKYMILLSPKTTFPYTAVYYTKDISSSEMVKDNLDLSTIKKELKAIY